LLNRVAGFGASRGSFLRRAGAHQSAQLARISVEDLAKGAAELGSVAAE
jgi:hypothetical protein